MVPPSLPLRLRLPTHSAPLPLPPTIPVPVSQPVYQFRQAISPSLPLIPFFSFTTSPNPEDSIPTTTLAAAPLHDIRRGASLNSLQQRRPRRSSLFNQVVAAPPPSRSSRSLVLNLAGCAPTPLSCADFFRCLTQTNLSLGLATATDYGSLFRALAST